MHTDWGNGDVSVLPGSSKDEQEMIEIMENFMNDHFLNQHVTDPTHKDGNTLDLILTNNPEIMYDMHITEPLKSTTHHFILQIASNLQHSSPGNTEDDQSNTVPPLKTLNFFSEKSTGKQSNGKLMRLIGNQNSRIEVQMKWWK